MNYVRLLRNIIDLRDALLGDPREFSQIIAPSANVAHRSAAFLMCCHGSIEAFLEWRAMEVASHHFDSYRAQNIIAPCFLTIIQYGGLSTDKPPTKFAKGKSYTTYRPGTIQRDLISKCYAKYIEALDTNNGIKESNLRRIYMPLGLDLSILDPTWLADMDSYGSWRGSIAHHARTPAQILSLHPATEYQRAKALLPGLKSLDEALKQLM